MRKIINKIKIALTNKRLTQYAMWAVMITTTAISIGSTSEAITLSSAIGLEDERRKVVDVLNKLLPDFKLATTEEGRKALAQRIGSEIIRDLDGGKSGKMDFYIDLFELFLNSRTK